MKRLFLTLVLLVAVVAGLGFYLGWFHLTTETVGGKTEVTVTVDKEKAKEQMKDAGHKVAEEVHKR